MPKLKAFLWRLAYLVIVVAILYYITPLLLDLLAMPAPNGPAIVLLKFAFGCLALIYLVFGGDPPYAPF